MQLSQDEHVLKVPSYYFKNILYFFLEIDFDLANSPDSDEMPHHTNVRI